MSLTGGQQFFLGWGGVETQFHLQIMRKKTIYFVNVQF